MEPDKKTNKHPDETVFMVTAAASSEGYFNLGSANVSVVCVEPFKQK